MKRFHFKLAPVERLRKAREEDALRAVGDAQRKVREAKDYRERLGRELRDALARREALGAVPTEVIHFQLENNYISGTKQRIIQAEQGILRASRGLEKAMRAYLYSRRETRTIEVLREKAQEEYKQQLAKHERKELEDLAIMRDRLLREGEAGE